MSMELGNLRLYKLHEIAKTFGVTVKALRDYCRAGKLPARKIGSKWFVTESALEDFFRGDQATETTAAK